MGKVADQIANMRKAQNKKEAEKKEMVDVVTQELLIEMKGALTFFSI